MFALCKVCGADVYDHESYCVRCTWPQGFPNVRICSKRAERRALDARSRHARKLAAKRGAATELDRLVALASAATIAFNRQLSQLFQWCSSADQCFRPWTWHVAKGQRVHPDSFNIGRIAFEHNVNPNFSDNVNFAYLDVGERNLVGYGPYKLRFRSEAVARRTTFLEKNAYYFCRQHGVVEPTLMPLGFRSTWDRKQVLALAKLGDKVMPGMTDSELENLLLHEGDTASPPDFLEAHIYNPIHVSAIESVRGPAPTTEEAPMWDYVRASLTTAGVDVQVRS